MNVNDYKEAIQDSIDLALCNEIKALESATFDYVGYDFTDVLSSCLTAALCEAGKRFVKETLND